MYGSCFVVRNFIIVFVVVLLSRTKYFCPSVVSERGGATWREVVKDTKRNIKSKNECDLVIYGRVLM